MLELAILGLLEGGEMHGYEIRRRLRDELGVFSNVSFGSLYPALSRLERAGSVESPQIAGWRTALGPDDRLTVRRKGRTQVLRSGASIGRRAKRVYRITENGRRQFVDLLGAEASGGDEARSFGLRLAFARYLPPQARLRLLERRRAQLAERLSATRATGRRALWTRTHAPWSNTQQTQPNERFSWLEELIELERSGASPAAAVAGPHVIPNPPRCPPSRKSRQMSKVKVAIAGVGNCASSLVQGVEYYREADPTQNVPGLMHVVLGGYHVGDIKFVAAFDVDSTKVGTDLSKAISAGHNNTVRFSQVGHLDVTVQRGPTFDGLGQYYRLDVRNLQRIQ